MSDERYEIAFSGEIAAGADLQRVKHALAKIFKADEARLAQMFSGKRILIKRDVDALTMAKYRGAFEKAGAICEIRSLSEAPAAESPASAPPAPTEAPPASAAQTSSAPVQDGDYQSKYPESDVVPQALLTEPLGIKGEQIDDLQAEIAPIGSQMQHEIKEVPDAQFDLSGLDIAPIGANLSEGKKESPPPPPDTSGLTMAD
jgi:hypothetical protein